MAELPRILLCDCHNARNGLSTLADALADELARRGRPADVRAADLCRLAAAEPGRLADLLNGGRWHVAACAPRALRWVLHRAGIDAAAHRLVDLRDAPPSELAERLLDGAAPHPRPEALACHGEEALFWYPVIDYDRCTACKQCVGFCLFGTYQADGQGVTVASPAACKRFCPACARVCPSGAVIFPKHHEAPVNGAPAAGGDSAVGLDDLAGVDVRKLLRSRSGRAARQGLQQMGLDADDARDVLDAIGQPPAESPDTEEPS